MSNNIIPYGRQNITKEDIDAVIDVLQSDYLTQGPKISEFETKFAQYIGSKYAVAVANGTAALHLCTMALGVNEGDKVISTPITFAASATFIDEALNVPAVVIDLYKRSIFSAISGVDPDVTFLMVVKVLILSPGTILSGE